VRSSSVPHAKEHPRPCEDCAPKGESAQAQSLMQKSMHVPVRAARKGESAYRKDGLLWAASGAVNDRVHAHERRRDGLWLAQVAL